MGTHSLTVENFKLKLNLQGYILCFILYHDLFTICTTSSSSQCHTSWPWHSPWNSFLGFLSLSVTVVERRSWGRREDWGGGSGRREGGGERGRSHPARGGGEGEEFRKRTLSFRFCIFAGWGGIGGDDRTGAVGGGLSWTVIWTWWCSWRDKRLTTWRKMWTRMNLRVRFRKKEGKNKTHKSYFFISTLTIVNILFLHIWLIF